MPATAASIKSATDAMVTRVRADLDKLKAQVAELQKSSSNLSPADQATLDEAEKNISALDPSDPMTLPPASP